MDIGISKSANPVSGQASGAGRLYAETQKAIASHSVVSRQQDAVENTMSEPSRQQVETAVASIQDAVQSVRRNVNFSLEDGSGRIVVKVTDAMSGDIIRQMPSEEALRLAENLDEVRSLLFKAEA